jgi:hypothetical protein
MKNKKINALRVWQQMEDLVVPRLRPSVYDRAMYFYLLRQSRLKGKQQLRFSILWLARGACVSVWGARKAVRRLIAKGVLRLAERSRAGHVVKVYLPEEIPSVRAGKFARLLHRAGSIEKADFFETRSLRQAIHARWWLLLLLPGPAKADGAVRRPCGAACAGRGQWLPQPGLLLFGL